MKTKIIPFDLETAKKIQAGEIEGKIKQQHGEEVEILCFDLNNDQDLPIAVKHRYLSGDDDSGIHVDEYSANGEFYDRGLPENDLVLEVPNNEPQFKPFDKVLVRRPHIFIKELNQEQCRVWTPALYMECTTDLFDKRRIMHRMMTNDTFWDECIPYAGNEHLVGTTDKPKEE